MTWKNTYNGNYKYKNEDKALKRLLIILIKLAQYKCLSCGKDHCKLYMVKIDNDKNRMNNYQVICLDCLNAQRRTHGYGYYDDVRTPEFLSRVKAYIDDEV